MSSQTPRRLNSQRAEDHFREAFERLKRGKPRKLPKGSKVTQNNVAREAGVDPSALRRARFPALVAEIQNWLETHSGIVGKLSPRQETLLRRAKNRDLREQLLAVRAERDDAMSKLVDAECHILSLSIELERLRASQPIAKVAPIRPAQIGKTKSSEK